MTKLHLGPRGKVFGEPGSRGIRKIVPCPTKPPPVEICEACVGNDWLDDFSNWNAADYIQQGGGTWQQNAQDRLELTSTVAGNLSQRRAVTQTPTTGVVSSVRFYPEFTDLSGSGLQTHQWFGIIDNAGRVVWVYHDYQTKMLSVAGNVTAPDFYGPVVDGDQIRTCILDAGQGFSDWAVFVNGNEEVSGSNVNFNVLSAVTVWMLGGAVDNQPTPYTVAIWDDLCIDVDP